MQNAGGLSVRAQRVFQVVVAQLGLRLDHARPLWIALLIGSLAVALAVRAADSQALTIGYFVATWLFYYGGNSLIHGARLNEAAIRRHGAETAFRRYEVLVGTMFLNQGLGIGAMSALDREAWRLPAETSEIAFVLGVAVFAVGFGVKFWAIYLVGLDTYYFKDLFLGSGGGPLVRSGPYRVFANPMYGLGEVHAYGFALMSGSLGGLIAAGVCHLGIFGFYFAIERPFVTRTYLASAK